MNQKGAHFFGGLAWVLRGLATATCVTRTALGIGEMAPHVSLESGQHCHLPPLIHVGQQVTKLTVDWVQQLEPIRAHLCIKDHHVTAVTIEWVKGDTPKTGQVTTSANCAGDQNHVWTIKQVRNRSTAVISS